MRQRLDRLLYREKPKNDDEETQRENTPLERDKFTKTVTRNLKED